MVVLRTLSVEEVGGRDWVMIDADCTLSDDPLFSEALCFGTVDRKEKNAFISRRTIKCARIFIKKKSLAKFFINSEF